MLSSPLIAASTHTTSPSARCVYPERHVCRHLTTFWSQLQELLAYTLVDRAVERLASQPTEAEDAKVCARGALHACSSSVHTWCRPAASFLSSPNSRTSSAHTHRTAQTCKRLSSRVFCMDVSIFAIQLHRVLSSTFLVSWLGSTTKCVDVSCRHSPVHSLPISFLASGHFGRRSSSHLCRKACAGPRSATCRGVQIVESPTGQDSGNGAE